MTATRHLHRFQSDFVRILALWILLTGIITTMVLNSLFPFPFFGDVNGWDMYNYVIGPGLLLLVGSYVGWLSTRPWRATIGTVFLLWGAMTLFLACLGGGCRIPENYEHWRHIKFAIDAGMVGPTLLVDTQPEPCTFSCSYRIKLIPLAIGYGSLAFALLADGNQRQSD